ncbi:helicase-related protein [Aeromicrobium panaciterrae]|uniref:helicase-related protein n=1 Tax=Aeromicrobium panaciterrae TaxID=363861 RepID=UPI00286BF58B|nr:helicase-related protein [Aeromicrobium panaciterrae]
MPTELSSQLKTHAAKGFEDDWKRQRRTARDILNRLDEQEGVILADQVGMGKTYVALAVAVSKILEKKKQQQVVVLVPPAVAQKWVDDWAKFSGALLDPDVEIRCVAEPIRSGEGLLAALDDPQETRSHLLVVTHTALTASLKDSFIQLALLQAATKGRPGVQAQRDRIAKWCVRRDGLLRDSRLTTDRVSLLLAHSAAEWRQVWSDITGQDLPDDPVPLAVQEALSGLDLSDLRAVIDDLPIRRSAGITYKLKTARASLEIVTQSLWRLVLSSTNLKRPLLIVDEAHRLKNEQTRISQLFAPRAESETSGALSDIFERIVLMTATPFELGHRELISVLSRLSAVRPMPKGTEPLENRLDALSEALQNAQAAAVTFDHDWGEIDAADAHLFDQWSKNSPPPTEASAQIVTAWRSATNSIASRKAMNKALAPWVIRHQRPSRRTHLPGGAILVASDADSRHGLTVSDEVVLPFLLAARAQSVAAEDGASRPLFAYGIASSFEAFRRLGSSEPDLDSDTRADDEDRDSGMVGVRHQRGGSAADWYRREIDALLVDGGLDRSLHPKIKATVDRATQLWLQGEKCVIFAWYVATGGALEKALAQRIEEFVLESGRKRLGLAGADSDVVLAGFRRISDRLLRGDSPGYELVTGHLRAFYGEHVAGAVPREREALIGKLVEATVRYLRRREVLVRFTDLHTELTAEQLWAGISGSNSQGISLLPRWQRFGERMAESGEKERKRVMDALLGDQGTTDAEAHGSGDSDLSGGLGARLDPVRRAHGGTRREDRERLTAVFNTPFAPDVLVASSVMGEGIDLHHECRHLIHHDLDWNPSVLEQRTGRLDRIGALAEHDGCNIDVYEPYLAGTHDEKMFRVVKDRAGWFDVVMGRPVAHDEAHTDAEESRVPLPAAIVDALTMDLESR